MATRYSHAIIIVLTEQMVQAGLWSTEITEDEKALLSRSGLHHYDSEEKLSVVTDEALQELGEHSENVNDVIFGLPSAWIQNGSLAVKHRPLLKKLCSDLTLKPAGFVTISEAIFHSLKAEDSEVSTVFAFVTKSSLEVALFLKGEWQGKQIVGRSDSITTDFTEAMARFQQPTSESDAWPHTVMFASQDLEKSELEHLTAAFEQYSWQEHGFAQPARIETRPRDTLLDAIVLRSIDVTVHDAKPEVAVMEDTAEKKPLTAVAPAAETAKSNFGFSSVLPHKNSPPSSHLPRRQVRGWKGFVLEHLRLIMIGVGSGLLVLLILAWFGATQRSTAIVKIERATAAISRDAVITLDAAASQLDTENFILPAKSTTRAKNGSQSKTTTGTGKIGDSASGEVEITNKTNGSVSIEDGTVLTFGDQTFTLDADVSIASASVETTNDGETKTYSKEKVSVTARTIGADGNLDSGTELQVGTFAKNDLVAEVVETFTGGSSRETRVVSAEDRKTLLSDLKESLLEEARLEFKKSDGLLVTGNVTVSSSKFSAEVDDETNSLSLDLELEIEVYEFSPEDLPPLAAAILASEIPEGKELIDEEPLLLITPAENTNKSEIALDTNITSKAVSRLNQDEIMTEIKGKSISEAVSSLENREEINSATIELHPRILEIFYKNLPNNTARITFELSNQ